MKLTAAGHDPMKLKRGIDKAVSATIEEARSFPTPVKSKEDIAAVATVSANGEEEIGDIYF